MIKIDKDIPFPERMNKGKSMYPFAAMKIGDSFLVPFENRNRVSVAMVTANRKIGKKFASKKVEDGIRVWRIA